MQISAVQLYSQVVASIQTENMNENIFILQRIYVAFRNETFTKIKICRDKSEGFGLVVADIPSSERFNTFLQFQKMEC